ncbi:MAG TPA: choice-of-anchor J domain-containing protein [Bacteroidales bacterium]|nr:choice-of-anchor J domain-containing protein [Bacteroidales bacterium]
MKKTSLLFVMLMVIFMSTKAQFSQNFNAVADGAMPSGWTVFNVDGLTPYSSVNWVTNAWVCKTYGQLATKAAWSTSYYTPAGTSNDWMFTPAITVPTAATPVLKYTVVAQDPDYPDGYELRIITTAPTSGNITTSTVLLTATAAETTPTIKVINLTAYAGQTVYIGWRNNSTDMFMLGVDDVEVKTLLNNDIQLTSINTPVCASPGNISITGTVSNAGFNAITSFRVTYTIDGGAPSAAYNVSSVNITSFGSYNFTHNVPATLAAGMHTIQVTISNINGTTDPNTANNVLSKDISIASQTTTCRPVFEEFTSSTCSPCASFNSSTFTPFITSYGTQFSYIKYQMNWPAATGWPNGDPYYTTEGGTRRVYYEVSGVPDLYVDGRASGMTSATMLSELNADMAKGTFFVISGFTPYYTGTTVTVPITITPYVTGTFKLHVVVIEKTTTGNVASNGETSFKHVMMDMLTGGTGLDINLTNGSNYTNTFTQNLSGSHVEEMSDLQVVVMIQENTSKVIYQSAESDIALYTGIDETSDGTISIYPNPAYENITISNAGNSDLMLYDIFGKVVMSENHISNNHLLNVSELAKGTYIMKIINGDNIITRKIAVIK